MTVAVAALAAVAAAAGSSDVSVQYAAYQPVQTTALAGDTVMWHNASPRTHTVTADDGSFAGSLYVGGMYSHSFDGPGAFTYHCTLHPEMHGEVDVYRLLLDTPSAAIAPGESYTLSGRAALPAGSTVTIQNDSSEGVATASVGADGRFSATVRPTTSTSYRAVSGGDASPRVLLGVLDRKVRVAIARHGGRVVVGARVVPAARGQRVVLQLHLPERFGWWPVRRARLDSHSRARFVIHTRRRVRARVLLTRADGVTPVARSAVVRAGASALAH